MIEREFVAAKLKEYRIQDFISSTLKNVGHSHTKVQKTPLGEKIIIYTSRPGLVVGRKGQNISYLTKMLKKKFDLENPQIEISEVEDVNQDPQIVAERIASSLERFGSKRFKGILHKSMEDVLGSGALGIEIVLGGKVPSSRAKSWRVYGGYIKKCGNIAMTVVKRAQAIALLKTGIIGIKVAIMPRTALTDDIELLELPVVEEGSPDKATLGEAAPETTETGAAAEKKEAAPKKEKQPKAEKTADKKKPKKEPKAKAAEKEAKTDDNTSRVEE